MATFDATRPGVAASAIGIGRAALEFAREKLEENGKAGLAVTQLCQKAVEMMGPLGYSRDYLLEKCMHDCKINDIFEGTGQINMLIVARNALGYRRDKLK